ncbi:MAG: glycosyltransferase family 4 protein [Elusimicrobiota bacterium]
MKKIILHVAQAEISEESGMGRVAWHWRNEFEKRGYEFIHIGPKEVGRIPHPALFPYAAYQTYRKLKKVASVFLIHEPASGIFVGRGIPTVVVSHGLERRDWELTLQGKGGQNIKWRTRLLFPIWRLRQCDLGLKKANLLLLINQEDALYAQRRYNRNSDILVFKNGVYPSNLNEKIQPENQITILFLGSWIERKGIRTLIEAATILHRQGLRLNYLVAGVSVESKTILDSWPEELHTFVEVVPHFSRGYEESLFARSNIFVLPSFFEGQPLSLLQAMESGRCCITTNCCGQKDLIQHGFNGLLHEPGDAKKLAFLIAKCAESKDLRIELGKNAKLSVKDRSWEAVSAEIVDRIEVVLNL